jgi:hypothetical protein
MVTRPDAGFGQSMTFGSTDGFDDALARSLGGKVDGAGAIPIERDAGLLRGNERLDGGDHIATCQKVRFDVIDRDFNAGFLGGDSGIHHHAVGHLAQSHGHQIGEPDVSPGKPGSQPDAEERQDDAKQQQAEDGNDYQDDGGQVEDTCVGGRDGVHGG